MLNLTNNVYGLWTVLYEGTKVNTTRYWVCKCICGAIKEIPQGNLRGNKSKGCKTCTSKNAIRTKSAFGPKHKFYPRSSAILSRCYNKSNPKYKDYGARGISVYHTWVNNPTIITEYLATLWYTQFGHSDYTLYGTGTNQYSIDRINNNEDYKPGNIRFATKLIQANNRRI